MTEYIYDLIMATKDDDTEISLIFSDEESNSLVDSGKVEITVEYKNGSKTYAGSVDEYSLWTFTIPKADHLTNEKANYFIMRDGKCISARRPIYFK